MGNPAANLEPLGNATNMATLSKQPKSLHELWREYMFGIDGRKPAHDFTPAERNTKTNKQKYYRRKHVWSTIERLTRNGHTVEMAIEKIRSVYVQNQRVTKIIEGIIRDKRVYRHSGGYHPNLV